MPSTLEYRYCPAQVLACIKLLQIKVINSLIWELIQIRKRTSQNQASTGHVNNVICLQRVRSLLEDILNHWLLPLVFALGCPCVGEASPKVRETLLDQRCLKIAIHLLETQADILKDEC